MRTFKGAQSNVGGKTTLSYFYQSHQQLLTDNPVETSDSLKTHQILFATSIYWAPTICHTHLSPVTGPSLLPWLLKYTPLLLLLLWTLRSLFSPSIHSKHFKVPQDSDHHTSSPGQFHPTRNFGYDRATNNSPTLISSTNSGTEF